MTKQAISLAKCLDKKQAKDIILLDISQKTTIADFFIIVTGKNLRHSKSLADDVEEEAAKLGIIVKSKEGHSTGEWILVDFGDIIVHIFTEYTRMYYSLERLWHGAKNIDIDKEL